MIAAEIGLFAAVLTSSLTTALVLSAPENRKTICLLVFAGLSAGLLKIWVFQQAPQWHDINPDSVTYDLNAQALALHWQGKDLPTEEYNLRGLRGVNKPFWSADEALLYASVYGTANWLYVGYLGLWFLAIGPNPAWAIYSNAALAAFFPAAAFGIALMLGAPRRVAGIAALITLIDPSTGVNASCLLKDTLVGFFTASAIWAALSWIRELRFSSLVVLTVGLVLLSASRFVAFIGLLGAMGCLVLLWLHRRKFRSGFGFVVVGILVIMLSAFIDNLPQPAHKSLHLISVNIIQPIKGGMDTLVASQGNASADHAVLKWISALKDNPFLAIVKSGAHTLFAPYPWLAIHPGLTWSTFNELYYPGMVLWIICLPGIFIELIQEALRRRTGGFFVFLFLGALLVFYTIFYGEWSTRQRVFALPIFFSLSAIGWSSLFEWWQKSCKSNL